MYEKATLADLAIVADVREKKLRLLMARYLGQMAEIGGKSGPALPRALAELCARQPQNVGGVDPAFTGIDVLVKRNAAFTQIICLQARPDALCGQNGHHL